MNPPPKPTPKLKPTPKPTVDPDPERQRILDAVKRGEVAPEDLRAYDKRKAEASKEGPKTAPTTITFTGDVKSTDVYSVFGSSIRQQLLDYENENQKTLGARSPIHHESRAVELGAHVTKFVEARIDDYKARAEAAPKTYREDWKGDKVEVKKDWTLTVRDDIKKERDAYISGMAKSLGKTPEATTEHLKNSLDARFLEYEHFTSRSVALYENERMSRSWIVRKTLENIRDMGIRGGTSEMDFHPDVSKEVKEAMHIASRAMPTDWIKTQAGENLRAAQVQAERDAQTKADGVKRQKFTPMTIAPMKIIQTDRGYCSYGNKTIAVSGGGVKGATSTATHELMHWAERNRSVTANRQSEFWGRRTKGYKMETIYQGTDEKGIKDGFTSHYQGKHYGPGEQHFEVMTMGVEEVLVGRGHLRMYEQDRDTWNFVVGMLAGA